MLPTESPSMSRMEMRNTGNRAERARRAKNWEDAEADAERDGQRDFLRRDALRQLCDDQSQHALPPEFFQARWIGSLSHVAWNLFF